MATKKQIEANRRNARKSTGPRSSDGKARSSLNSLKSGIDAKSQVIRGESPAALEALKSEYYDRYRPSTPEQRMLVDTLIDSEWLLRRFRLCESQLWEQSIGFALMPNTKIEVAQAYRGNVDFFDRLQRRINAAQRNYRHALHELERLQAAEVADPEPATPTNHAAKPENGFVPQNPSITYPHSIQPDDIPPPDRPEVG